MTRHSARVPTRFAMTLGRVSRLARRENKIKAPPLPPEKNHYFVRQAFVGHIINYTARVRPRPCTPPVFSYITRIHVVLFTHT